MFKRMLMTGLVFLLSATLIAPAYGWYNEGHMIVAYIAYQQLTPAAKTRANALIKMNPMYSTWAANVPKNSSQATIDMMVFMQAATWADAIKSAAGYVSDGSDGGDSPVGSPNPTENSGYGDMSRHMYWHFTDKPFATDGTALPAIPTPNAQDRIALFRSVLSSTTASDALKSYDLVWILHLVGDVHQPLHSSTRVDKADPNGDAGGNLVKLSCTGCPTELHRFWDDVPGTSLKPKSAVTAGKKLPAADPTEAAKSSEAVWVDESFQDAQADVYITPIGAGTGPFALTSAYKKNAKKVANVQLALAGARLANLINNELK
jgi:S1/P1 Nuclease